MLADLYALPSPSDATIVCTNIRGMTGARPVWADHTDSIFYFPWGQMRFLEVPQDRGTRRPADAPVDSGRSATGDESDDDIDEDFLRRVRDA